MQAYEKIRLAVVTETYPPDLNGVAISLARLIDGLLARGHQIDLYRVRPASVKSTGSHTISRSGFLACPDPKPHLEITELAGLPIPAYPELRMGFPAGHTLETRWVRRRPDLVHIATEGPLGWSALRMARKLGIPVSSDFRTNFDHYSVHYGAGWLARPIGMLLRTFHNRADLTTVPTNALKSELASRGFQRLRVLGRGVDTTLFTPHARDDALRASWGAGPRNLVAICVGRLAAEKNLELAIQAFQKMRQRANDARLVMVGDGPLRGALEKLCPEVIFAGRRSGHDLARHYASADIFLFPSMSETFGNVVTEAMASGLATVAFRHAAAADLIDSGQSGLLADVYSERDFIRASQLLATDPIRRRVLGEGARRAVSSLDWSVIAMQFESIVSALLDGERPKSSPFEVSRLRARSSRAI